MQVPGLPGGGQDSPTPPDTTAALGQLGRAVERVTEVRSFDDVWRLAGEFREDLIRFAFQAVVAVAVLAVFFGVYLVVRATLRPVFERSRLEEDARNLLESVAKFSILGFGVILSLDQLGLNVTSLVAGLGVAGLALGFAAKDTLANFIAGVTILWDRPFRVGDRVEADGEFGQVKKITLRSTRIHTGDNKVVIIPNQNIVNNKIINHTMQASLRTVIAFGIAYDADMGHTREVVLELVRGDDRVRERPPAEVAVTELAASSVNMELRFWLKNPHQELPLESEYLEKIKLALDAAGIGIPYPQLSLRVEQMPSVRVLPPPAREPGAEAATEDS
ncbi:MAG TPA: mechanosensitive ion channel family protein [Gemmatimonadota bacterium]|nr:mechanosensitive ion channel family protein [Gemmatimonadota bacterium]